jgi:hypothetical protein
MLRVVASQQSPLKSKLQPRRPGLLRRAPRDERLRTAQPDAGAAPQTLIEAANPNRGLRLVEEGAGPGDGQAPKERRTTMQTTDHAVRLPGLVLMGRAFAAARSLLAGVGFTVLVAAALFTLYPQPREWLWQRLSGMAASAWDDQIDRENIAAGPIQTGASALENEQRALTDFISRRYRVANDAIAGFVATAYRAGLEAKVDPLLILAVMAIESRYNPVAESHMGARGLMQIIPKFHLEKLVDHGGESALLDPEVNIQVGARILREYTRRFGDVETGLQMYAGAFDQPTSQYSAKVLAERARLEQMVALQRRAVVKTAAAR